MKLLLRSLLQQRKHLVLLVWTLISMCFLTVANQLEILSVGILTNKNSLVGEGFFNDVLQFFSEIFAFNEDYRYLAYLILTVALIKAVALFFQKWTSKLVAIRVSRDLRANYFAHIQKLSLDFYQKHHIGSLSARVVGDASLISEAINSCLTNYIQTPFTVLSTLILCFFTSWQLSLLIFFGFPLIVYPILFLARRIKRLAKELQKNQESFATVLIDFLSGIQTIKLFAMESFSQKKYEEQNERMAQLERRSARYDVSSRPIIHTIGMFFLGFALLFGLYVLNLSVPEVLVYCGFLYIFYEPIKKFAEENANIQRGIAAAERMWDVLSVVPTIQDRENADELSGFNDKIEFKNVWFKYGENWVLKDLSFTVKKGEKVAIVGPTGAGKSTIAQLLPRLFEVQKGEITIDGVSINQFRQNSLREQISFVPQKPFLFLDTIAENITFGRAFTQREITRAAKEAHAEEFIDKLPGGYHTYLDEAGKNLSGGQQQRLAIARALIKKAPILVLDEATSSLDTLSEKHIKDALHELRGSVTQLIIAHRLSTIEDADRIIFIDHGVKLAEGSIDELLKTCLPFKAMWQQSSSSQIVES